jgi:hypothetical protein
LNITSDVITYDTNPPLAADRVHVHLPNENVDSDFRIESIDYKVVSKSATLTLSIELGKAPPVLADYLYGLRTFTVNVEKLSRTKLGRGGSSGGGGGSAGFHHASHEAAGADALSGWLAPTYIGPYSDAAATIYFRVRNKAGVTVLNHTFAPFDDAHGSLGLADHRWLAMHTSYLAFNEGVAKGHLNPNSDNAFALGTADLRWLAVHTAYLAFNEGVAKGTLYPDGDNTRALGNADARWLAVHTAYLAFAEGLAKGNLAPDLDNTRGLGFSDKRWASIHAAYASFYNILMSGTEIVRSDRYLYNVTTSADIITSGGITEDVAVAKVGGGTRTLHFTNSKYTGYTDS